jgi:hypothetical protein
MDSCKLLWRCRKKLMEMWALSNQILVSKSLSVEQLQIHCDIDISTPSGGLTLCGLRKLQWSPWGSYYVRQRMVLLRIHLHHSTIITVDLWSVQYIAKELLMFSKIYRNECREHKWPRMLREWDKNSGKNWTLDHQPFYMVSLGKRWTSYIYMKQNKETSCNCFKWSRDRFEWERRYG